MYNIYGSETIIFVSRGNTAGRSLIGPLFFCLALHPLLLSLQSELIIGFIDDITVGGPKSVVTRDVEFIKESGVNIGLLLNAVKCELITLAEPEQDCILNSFTIFKPSEASLLGAPPFSGTALDDALKRRHDDFVRLSANIRSIYAHDALLIMKFSLSTPKILHLLRCSPYQGHPLLTEMDELFRSNICHIVNVNLTEMQWTRASLSCKNGGLGVRRASSLVLPDWKLEKDFQHAHSAYFRVDTHRTHTHARMQMPLLAIVHAHVHALMHSQPKTEYFLYQL